MLAVLACLKLHTCTMSVTSHNNLSTFSSYHNNSNVEWHDQHHETEDSLQLRWSIVLLMKMKSVSSHGWVSSFLTAHQHILVYLLPHRVHTLQMFVIKYHNSHWPRCWKAKSTFRAIKKLKGHRHFLRCWCEGSFSFNSMHSSHDDYTEDAQQASSSRQHMLMKVRKQTLARHNH